jgi:hypothetical protein
MSEDNRDYIARTQARATAYDGKELTPDEMARHFMKCDLDARVDILEQLGADNGDHYSVKDAAKAHAYRRALLTTHERLRKVGR